MVSLVFMPGESHCLPGEQHKHVESDVAFKAAEYLPAGHSVGKAEPLSQYPPAVHPTHELRDVPEEFEYVPAGHKLQLDEPGRANDPYAHAWHEIDPYTDDVPAGQGSHEDPDR